MVHKIVWLFAFWEYLNVWEYLNGTHISLALCLLGIFDLNGTYISLALCFLGIFEWYTDKFGSVLSGNI